MSLFVKLFSARKKVREMPCQPEETETLLEGEEFLMKKKEFLKKRIDQELLIAKKNSRKNRRGALLALRKKKWYEAHIKYIDRTVKAVRSAHEHIDTVNKVNDLIKDITEEHDLSQDMSDTLHTSVSSEVEFDEHELLAELERLEEILVSCPKVSPAASPSKPAKTEEDEFEDDLECLRRWVNEPS